jgi:hypothetical protein
VALLQWITTDSAVHTIMLQCLHIYNSHVDHNFSYNGGGGRNWKAGSVRAGKCAGNELLLPLSVWLNCIPLNCASFRIL